MYVGLKVLRAACIILYTCKSSLYFILVFSHCLSTDQSMSDQLEEQIAKLFFCMQFTLQHSRPKMSLKKPSRVVKVSKGAKIRNRYNQVPHLTQDTNGKVTNSQLDTTNESQ